MLYQDNRTTIPWATGNMVITAADQRYVIVELDFVDGTLFRYSLLSTASNRTVMTRPSISELETAFTALYSIKEIISGNDLMIVAIND